MCSTCGCKGAESLEAEEWDFDYYAINKDDRILYDGRYNGKSHKQLIDIGYDKGIGLEDINPIQTKIFSILHHDVEMKNNLWDLEAYLNQFSVKELNNLFIKEFDYDIEVVDDKLYPYTGQGDTKPKIIKGIITSMSGEPENMDGDELIAWIKENDMEDEEITVYPDEGGAGVIYLDEDDGERLNLYNAESFEAETSTKEMNKAYKQYKINLEKYVGFGDLWEKIHDESLRLQSQGLIAFDAWNKACKKFKVYDKLTKGVNMEHLREREKRYEPDSYYGGAESFGAESNFDKLANKIAAQYRKKGTSAKEAMRIGKATAAKIGFKKYGKAGMRRKAMRGRMAKGAEGSMPKKSIIPNVIIFGVLGVTAYLATKIKSVEFGADGDCGCGCKGAKVGGCGDTKQADEGHYPETFDPVQDWLPRYRYPADSDWSNSYNPADPYRPLDYQTVQVDSRTTVDKMGMI